MSVGAWVIVAILVFLAVAAPRYGADTREPRWARIGDPVAQPRYRYRLRQDVATLVRMLRRAGPTAPG